MHLHHGSDTDPGHTGAQVAFNRASHAVPQINAELSNCLGLLLFTLIAAALFWRHTRYYVRMWAEALAVTKDTDNASIRCLLREGAACYWKRHSSRLCNRCATADLRSAQISGYE